MKDDKKKSKKLLSIASVLLLFLIWQLICTIWNLEGILPKPTEVIAKIYDMTVHKFARYSLLVHIAYSGKRVLIAFVIGSSLGMLLGFSMGWNKTIRAIFNPLFNLLRCIPPIAWIPLLIMWFGIGETSKVAICFLGAFAPVTINCFNGIKNVENIYLESVQALGGKSRDMFKYVAIPSAARPLFAGLQNAMSNCWVTVLAAEMVSSNEGLGYIILKGMERNDTTVIFAGMITIAIVGIICASIVRVIERVTCPW